MTARFKVDEDLPAQVAEMLVSLGHDARTVIEAAIAQLDLDANAGAIVVVTQHGLRIRRASKQ